MTGQMANPQESTLKSRICQVLWVASLIIANLACSGAGFERAPNAKKHRALPLGATVYVAANASDLVQPVEYIGLMRASTKGDPANRAEAEETFKTAAARYGCDAIAEVQSTRREVKTTRRNRTLGANGVPVYTDEVILAAEHDWTGKCLRTPDAPPEAVVATQAAKAEPKPADSEPKAEPVRKPKPKPEVKPKPEPKPEPKAEVKPKAEPKQEPRPEPKVEPKPEPKVEPKAEVKPTPKAEPKPEPKTGPDPIKPAVPVGTNDAKVASEVARAFLNFSDAMAKGSVERLCAMIDESAVISIDSTQPTIKLRQEFTAAEACESFKTGELATYLRELGPAEVHAEPSTLIPTLFGIHGGAYLTLTDVDQKRYADQVVASRAGKKALACTIYNVVVVDELYKVNLVCDGVRSFRAFFQRTGDKSLKLRAFSHAR